MTQTFRSDLEKAINANSAENGSNTPDFIIADFLEAALGAFDTAVKAREQWYGRENGGPAPCLVIENLPPFVTQEEMPAALAATTVDPNTYQVDGSHYASDYQHWDFVIDTGMSYLQGTASKYPARWRKKNGIRDLEKSLHFIHKAQTRQPNSGIMLDMGLLNRYAAANNLTDYERGAVWAIAIGNWEMAASHVRALIEEARTQGVGLA